MAKNHKIPKCPPLRFPQFNDEWKQTTLGSYFKVQGGYAFKSEYYRLSGIPIIRISNLPMDRRYIDLSDCVYYPSKFNIDNQFKVQKGDLLIAMSGATTGKTSIYNYNRFSYLNQRVGLFRPIARNVFYPILYAYVESDNFKLSLGKLLIAGAQPNISSSDIEGIPFPVFSLAEQEKIASFLSLIDERIQSCSETIKERKREKAALLNQLFSQKLRFPDFDDEWRVTTLGTILSLAPQIPIDKPCIKDIISVKLHGKGISRTSATTLNLGATQYYLRRVGQLIYGKQNFHNGAIALIPKEYDNGITSKDIPSFVFDTTKSSPKYVLAYLLRTKYYEATEVYTTGTGSKRLKEDSFFSLPLSLPSLVEQKKIADFLSLIDERIEVEEELLEQYERQKRYLLRQMFV